MGDREELDALRRMAELEAKSGPTTPAPARTFWDTVKQEARPDIFNTEHAAYNLGGKVTDATAPYVPAKVAAGLGYGANVAAQALPVVVGAFGGSAVGKPLMEETGRGFMKSAIKPSVANLDKGRVPQAVETMLEGGYSPTNAGVAAMRSKVSSLTEDLVNALAPSKGAVNIHPALENVAGVANQARAATMGAQDAKSALDVGKSLIAHPAVDDLGLMGVQAAQAMKQANYKSLGDAAYGMGLKPAAERDAIKAVTAALRQGIEQAEPAVAPINSKISDLVNAIKVSQRRALIEGNKDIIPLGASVATALSNPAAALGLYANSSAAVKSMLARMLYSGAKAVPQAAGGAIGGVIGAQSGSAPSETELAQALRR